MFFVFCGVSVFVTPFPLGGLEDRITWTVLVVCVSPSVVVLSVCAVHLGSKDHNVLNFHCGVSRCMCSVGLHTWDPTRGLTARPPDQGLSRDRVGRAADGAPRRLQNTLSF